MSTQILRPEVDVLIPQIKTPYVDIHRILEASLALVCPDDLSIPPSNILYNSPHGLGKTLLAATLALEVGKKLGKKVPMVVYDCSEDTRKHDLHGVTKINSDGTTAFELGPFPLVINLANEVGFAVLCAEEISALTPGAQKQFNALTDWRDSIYISGVGNFRLNAGSRIAVIGTMNPSAYGGVYTLNDDLRSRFDEFIVPVPTKEQERKILKKICSFASNSDIENITQVAQDSRTDATDYMLSTRDLVRFLQNRTKLPDSDIPMTLIANKFEEGDRDTMVDRINGKFKSSIK